MMRITVIFLTLVLSACATPVKYVALPDTGITLKQVVNGNVYVDTFDRTNSFNAMCRLGTPITPPDFKSTFEGYIQNGLIEELKAAGKYDEQPAKIKLSGTVEDLAFSTTVNGFAGGFWDIKLRVKSSNGKSTVVSEHYEFESSFFAATACLNARDAFLPAVQNLISKLVKSREFKDLVKI